MQYSHIHTKYYSNPHLSQLSIALRDDHLEVLPGVDQGLHGEPGVGVSAHVEALDLLVQLGQRVKVGVCRGQAGLELGVRLAQRADLLD